MAASSPRTGKLDLESAEKGYDLDTRLRLFNLRSVASRGPVTSLTATAMAKGRGFDPKTMQAAFSANVQHSAVDSLSVDSANIRVAVDGGMATMDSVTIHTPFAQLFVDGKIGTAPGHSGDLRYIVSVDTLSALRRFIANPDSSVVPIRPAVLAAALARARADSARQANRNEVALQATGRPQPQIKLDSLHALRRDSVDGAVRTAGIVHGSISDFDVRGRLSAENIIARGSGLHRAPRGVRRGKRRHASHEVRRWRILRFPLRERLRARLGNAPGDVREAVGNGGARGVPGFRLRVSRRRGVSAQPRQQPGAMARALAAARQRALGVGSARDTCNGERRGILVHDLDLRNGSTGRIYANGVLPVTGPMNLDLDVTRARGGESGWSCRKRSSAHREPSTCARGSREHSVRRRFAERSA